MTLECVYLFLLANCILSSLGMTEWDCRSCRSCKYKFREYVVKVEGPFSNVKALCHRLDFKYVDKVMGFTDLHFIHSSCQKPMTISRNRIRLARSPNVLWFEEQRFLIRKKRSSSNSLLWNDPLYPEMWYLNRASYGQGYDMNVLEAWDLGYTGKGVVITIMDDGIDHTHPDLMKNYDPDASTDINARDNDPMPNIENRDNKHGTRCAGQIAAQGNNSVCVVGIAYNARIGGIRMLDGYITDRVEAETLGFRQDYIDIYSGSWGPEDSGKLYEGPGVLAQSAFQRGVVTGRNGFGSIYVWASGNGGSLDDSCACDGYASNPFTLSVSGVGELNTRPWYLEKCSSTLVSTYSSGSPTERMISTVDLEHKCTRMHTGTSASAPMAAGIIALLLEANPRLSWRDVQYVTLLTANPRPFKDGNFTRNAVGRLYSQLYGYGLMDAGKMVRLGELWRGVPSHHRCTSSVMNVQKQLEGKFNHSFLLNFTGCQPTSTADKLSKFKRSSFEAGTPVRYLEHVQVYADIIYQKRGLLQLSLVSPSGTLTVLQPPRIHDDYSGNIGMSRWPVTTVQLWGEQANGTWEIRLDNIVGSELHQLKDGYKTHDTINSNFVGINKGIWRSVWIVAYGTEEFPIRLKPPSPKHPPPTDWFEAFAPYVVDDTHWHKAFTCHSECAPGGCSGPGANQCLFGCKNFATESRQCVATCPPGTTAFGAARLNSISLQNLSNSQKSRDRIKIGSVRKGRMRLIDGLNVNNFTDNLNRGKDIDGNDYFPSEMVCQPCWSLCAQCILPHTEYDCTACSNGRYLVPLLMATNFNRLDDNLHISGTAIQLRLPNLFGTCRTECPPGYYANKTNSICFACPENCAQCDGPNSQDCRLCNPGYRFVHGRCIDGASVDGRCKPTQYLKSSQCFDCDRSCGKFGCLSNKQCIWCPAEAHYQFNSSCVSQCPLGWYVGHQLTIPLSTRSMIRWGTLNYSVYQCAPCPPGCLQCTNFTNCEICKPHLILKNQHCVLNENNYTQVNNQSLNLTSLTCDPNLCLKCDPLNQECLKCAKNHYLFNINPFLFISSFIKTMTPTKSFIISNQSNSSSLQIETFSIVNTYPSYICVPHCPMGYFTELIGNQITCSQCPPSCSVCADVTKCISCKSGFSFIHETKQCVLNKICRQSHYYSVENDVCMPCDKSCQTCIGPLPTQCTSCVRKSPNPYCLNLNNPYSSEPTTTTSLNSIGGEDDPVGEDSESRRISNLKYFLYLTEQLANSASLTGSVTTDSITMVGRCSPCCSRDVILLNREPKSCMFCIADKITCLRGEEVGAGEGGLLMDFSPPQPDTTPSTSFTKTSYLILLICGISILLLISSIIIHLILSRRRPHRGHVTMAHTRRTRRQQCNNRHSEKSRLGCLDEDEVRKSLKPDSVNEIQMPVIGSSSSSLKGCNNKPIKNDVIPSLYANGKLSNNKINIEFAGKRKEFPVKNEHHHASYSQLRFNNAVS